ncbi:GNAT superfamily N-acetyltransferase [Nitrobacteraceae bacterium AZCC 2161]
MRITRRAEHGDLASLLDVYRHLNPAMPTLPEDRIRQIWNKTLASTDTALFVSVIDRLVVSTCLLVTGPNLMRGGAPHALLENVGTHRDHLRQGHGRATIAAALKDAWSRGCHHVFLVTGRGRANPYALSFYESCGFETGGKTGLMALRPDSVSSNS